MPAMRAPPAIAAPPISAAPRRVVMLAFPGVQVLDVTGPLDILAGAGDELAAAGRGPGYAVTLAAAEPEPIPTSCGVALVPHAAFADLPRAPIDTLMVAGGTGVHEAVAEGALLAAIARLAPGARRVASVCSGAFALARAGLLDGRRAVTHWAHCERLAREHPAVTVEPDPIWVRDGRVWTSAGVTAGMDLTLALVEADHGRDLALAVARRRVMFLKRPGGQSQFSAELAAQAAAGPVARAQAFVLDHLDADLDVETLAAVAGMSPRNFARVFAREAGLTPAAYVEAVRVAAARRHLEEGDQPIERVAALAGFRGRERMRRAFLRRLGTGPQTYRERFRTAHLPEEERIPS
jgi:transcriptional regulator GlxA family with amidase domain